MVICVCGKTFQTEAGRKQHIRRRYCRGQNAENGNKCSYCPADDQRSFLTYAGLRQHIRLSHPSEYNEELETQAENPIRDESRWTMEELSSMAMEEIKFKGRFVNKHLAGIFRNRGVEAIKSRRRLPDYIELRNQLRYASLNSELCPNICASSNSTLRPNTSNNTKHREVILSSSSSSDSDIIVVEKLTPISTNRTLLESRHLSVSSPKSRNMSHTTNSSPTSENEGYLPTQPIRTLNPEALEYNPVNFNTSISNLTDDPIMVYLNYFVIGNYDIWDEKDMDLINALSVKAANIEFKKLLLENWVKAILKSFVKPKRKPRTKSDSTPFCNIEPTKQRKSVMRSMIYKKTQEMYRKNRAELAECIIDDRSPLSAIEQPSIDALTRKFTDVFSTESIEDNFPILDAKKETSDLYAPILPYEISMAIKSTKSNSAGPDGLRIKHLKQINLSKLVLFYNVMLHWGCIPDVLKNSRTILIPKSGDTTKVDNWRPLTISSILLRIVNKIIGKRFIRLPIHQLQRGFRNIDGVFLNNMTLDLIIRERRQARQPYNIVSIDLRKAFDSVSHTSIKRALNRFKVDERLCKFILDGYTDTSTTLQLGSYQSDPIKVRCGVKQGDPLSPYLFNMIIDELIETLQKKNTGISLNNTKISCMCYADDLILLGTNIKETQAAIKITTTFLNQRGLEINHKKCIATSVGIVPGKKILYTITKNIFYAQGYHIPQNSVNNFWKYLGSQISSAGICKPPIQQIKTQLLRIEKAPLKPPQKLTILKTYFIPRLLHLLQTPRITMKMLKDVDTFISVTVRRILHLNKTCTDAYIHAPIKCGGLGILSMKSHVPIILFKRMQNIITSHDQYGIHLSQLKNYKKLQEKLCIWTQNADNTATAARDWGQKLESSYSGNGILQGHSNFHSGSWIDNPPTYWSGGDFVKAVQLRGNLLPTMGIPSNPKEKRKCRAGCERTESLSHVLQRCPVTHWNRIRRHDRIVNLLKKMITKNGWQVEVEPRIRCASGVLKIPDLVCIKNEQVIVCDVAIPWEGPQSLNATYAHKQATYGDTETINAISAKFPNRNIKVEALIIGARGIWCSLNDSFVRVIGLRQSDVRILINNVIGGSIIVHREFMKSVFK